MITLLATLCFTNAYRGGVTAPSARRSLVNAVVVMSLMVLASLTLNDAVVAPLLALCGLGPAASLIGAAFMPSRKRS